ncbi:hypothetical protein [Sphingobium yanoikuyae]|uniref:hypothetical protein n=1 Tax=Sphingobium yanoikuyae TaxID=13690 RepID=UPI0028AFE04C|nr:hypothetical protein [Sphingobium yanoikuyae]
MSTTKRAKIVRDFKDAGTERSFIAGETVDLTAGEFANYEAAGLIEAVAATKAADDTKKA